MHVQYIQDTCTDVNKSDSQMWMYVSYSTYCLCNGNFRNYVIQYTMDDDLHCNL